MLFAAFILLFILLIEKDVFILFQLITVIYRRDKSIESERKKRRCRDYDEKGYCMKGDQCIYDHGPDPVVVDDIALEKMVGSGKGATNVPQITHNFSIPPPGYTPLNPPPPGVDNVYVANSNALHPVGLSEGFAFFLIV